jgi:hypothetical protein
MIVVKFGKYSFGVAIEVPHKKLASLIRGSEYEKEKRLMKKMNPHVKFLIESCIWKE